MTGLAVAGLLATAISAQGQASQSTAAPETSAQQPQTVTLSNQADAKKDKGKLRQSKDTRKANRREKKTGATPMVATADSKLPDRQLYDKAQTAIKKAHFDVARLDLQTLLNTYPDSQFQMKAKLAIADSWFKEGGTAALTQAEQEYKDFITFFPNAPEAAEAQMRVGDIYFRQMDKPDRDYAKATHAEEEYRLMLQQFPDSTLVPQAKQRLREVQEVLATREAEIGSFYGSKENWAAMIARYQTVADTYPQFSHMDVILLGLGQGYEAEARVVRMWKGLPEDARARLLKIYDDQAATAYNQLVLEHSASIHVDDARDRLAAMHRPIPTPTAEQAAASAALENSRHGYTIQSRVNVLLLRRPDTVMAARIGEPPLSDPKPTMAPDVTRTFNDNVRDALNPAAAAKKSEAVVAATPADTTAAPAAKAPLQFNEVPTADQRVSDSNQSTVSDVTPVTAASPGKAASGTSIGVEVVNPSTTTSSGGLRAVGPTDQSIAPPVERPAVAPDAVNEVTPGSTPPAQAPAANGKNVPKPALDKSEASSSKHKRRKGMSRMNPF